MMPLRHVLLAITFWAAFVILPVSAQVRWYAPGGFGGGWGYGGGFGGGTPASFAPQAMADMVQAQGAYNMMSSAAMVNVEEARGKYIENQKQWTELYQMRSRVRAEQQMYAEQSRRERVAARQAREKANPPAPPAPLTSQFDPSTGKINWPIALQTDNFAELRKELESLFAARAHTGTTADLTEAIVKDVREMREELRKRIREMPSGQYIEARKFLDGLAQEGQTAL